MIVSLQPGKDADKGRQNGRENGDHSVFQGVAHHGLTAGQTLGPGQQHIFGRQVFDQLASQVPGDRSDRTERECQDRQDHRIVLFCQSMLRIINDREPGQFS